MFSRPPSDVTFAPRDLPLGRSVVHRYEAFMSDRTPHFLRPLWLLFGLLSVGLGILGIFLPILPTTPLMILAAFFFAKSSPRLEAKLLNHKTFGLVIQDWRLNGTISRRIKLMAVGTMVGVFVISLIIGLKPIVLIIQAVGMGLGAAFVLTRPSGD